MSHCLVNQLIHIIWSTHNQQYAISSHLKEELYAYITALISSKGGKLLAAGGATDHIHILTVLPPDISLTSFLSHIKAFSSKWFKKRETIHPDFNWQNGYLAVSTQEDRIENVCSYIRSDTLRHQSKSYSEELLGFLKQQNINYDEQYFLQSSISKIYIHAIWSTINRIPFLDKSIRNNLYCQMASVVSKFKGVVHAIGGIEDHVHLLMEAPKDKALSDLIRETKTSATHWLKAHDREPRRYRDFEWQTGYGAFTVSPSSLEVVKSYIQKQEEHHQKRTFQDEWNDLMMRMKV